jgi:uncharacterized caspase-like protein
LRGLLAFTGPIMKKLIVRVTVRITLVASIAFAVVGGSVEAWAERRVALVVGNATYRVANISLANPRNDAEDISDVLKTLGFEVITTLNANKRDMDLALQKFARLATDADSALFFYAGHALQFQGRNFLMPTDADLEDEISLRYQAVSMEDVRAALDRANGVKIMILDACRNNPLADRVQKAVSGASRAALATTRGLARIDKTQGMVIAYATAADEVAQDGRGRNSPFTTALLKWMQEPGLDIEIMLRRVAADVNTQTGGRQRPERYISLLSEYYLNQNDRIVWDRIKDQDDLTALRDFIIKYPASPLALSARNRLDMLERFAREREETARREEADRRARDEEQRRKAAEAEAQRKQAEAEAQRKREAEAEVKRRQAEAETQRKREAEAEAQRKQAEADTKRKQAEAEAQQKREAQAETQRKQAEAEAQRKREAEAEAQRKLTEAEAQRKLTEAEAQRKREAQTETQRKLAEAEAQRKREAEAEAQRKLTEAEAQRKREAEAEAQRKLAEAEAQQKREAQAEAQRKLAEAEAQRKREADRLAALDLQRQEERKREEAARQQADLERRRIEETCNREEAKLDELKAAGAAARAQLVKLESDVECKTLRQLVTAALKALPADVPVTPVQPAVPVEAQPPVKANLPEQIKQAQTELRRLACYKGPIDGKLNDATHIAVKEWSKTRERPVVDVNITDDFIADLKKQPDDICLPKAPPQVVNRSQHPKDKEPPVRQRDRDDHRTATHAPQPYAPPAAPPRPTAQSTATAKPPTALGTGF